MADAPAGCGRRVVAAGLPARLGLVGAASDAGPAGEPGHAVGNGAHRRRSVRRPGVVAQQHVTRFVRAPYRLWVVVEQPAGGALPASAFSSQAAAISGAEVELRTAKWP